MIETLYDICIIVISNYLRKTWNPLSTSHYCIHHKLLHPVGEIRNIAFMSSDEKQNWQKTTTAIWNNKDTKSKNKNTLDITSIQTATLPLRSTSHTPCTLGENTNWTAIHCKDDQWSLPLCFITMMISGDRNFWQLF